MIANVIYPRCKSALRIGIALGLALFFQQASASVTMYQAAVQADADALHLWSLQGDASTRLLDSVGSNHLIATSYGSGSTAAIAYGSGFGGVANSAATPQRIDTGGQPLRPLQRSSCLPRYHSRRSFNRVLEAATCLRPLMEARAITSLFREKVIS